MKVVLITMYCETIVHKFGFNLKFSTDSLLTNESCDLGNFPCQFINVDQFSLKVNWKSLQLIKQIFAL